MANADVSDVAESMMIEVTQEPRERSRADADVSDEQALQRLIASGAVPRLAARAIQDARASARASEDKLLRGMAEMDNRNKRLERERLEQIRHGNETLLRSLLPVRDNIERALSHAQATSADSLLIDGLSLTLSQFRDVLASAGVTEIAAEVGEPFDPQSHEAVTRVPDSGLARGAISGVLQLGFRLHDRVLRPTRVAVAA